MVRFTTWAWQDMGEVQALRERTAAGQERLASMLAAGSFETLGEPGSSITTPQPAAKAGPQNKQQAGVVGKLSASQQTMLRPEHFLPRHKTQKQQAVSSPSLLAPPASTSAPGATPQKHETSRGAPPGETSNRELALVLFSNSKMPPPSYQGDAYTVWDPEQNRLMHSMQRRHGWESILPLRLVAILEQHGIKLIKRDESLIRLHLSLKDAEAEAKLHLVVRNPLKSVAVVAVPLQVAVAFALAGKQGNQRMQLCPDAKQVVEAKRMLRKQHGTERAEQFTGIPVFSLSNTRMVVTSIATGEKLLYQPWFFSKQHMFKTMNRTYGAVYQQFIQGRRAQRHASQQTSVAADAEEDDGFSGDPPEVREFLEETGERVSTSSFDAGRALKNYLADTADNLFIGTAFGRRIIKLRNPFEVAVSSFEQLVGQSFAPNAAEVFAKYSDGPLSPLLEAVAATAASDVKQPTTTPDPPSPGNRCGAMFIANVDFTANISVRVTSESDEK
eukprot:jgi/Chlat1/6959/Chrsp52S06629